MNHGWSSLYHQNNPSFYKIKGFDLPKSPFWPLAFYALYSSNCGDFTIIQNSKHRQNWTWGSPSHQAPKTKMWLVPSHFAGTSSMRTLRPSNSSFNAWSSIVHCTMTYQTSSTNFSVVGPMTTNPMVHCICCIPFSLVSIDLEIWLDSSAQGCVLSEMIEAFCHNSSIWTWRAFPS